MLAKSSLVLHIGIGNSIGLVVGLMAFFLAPLFGESDLLFRVGVALWITTMGVYVGLIMAWLTTKFGGEGRATLRH